MRKEERKKILIHGDVSCMSIAGGRNDKERLSDTKCSFERLYLFCSTLKNCTIIIITLFYSSSLYISLFTLFTSYSSLLFLIFSHPSDLPSSSNPPLKIIVLFMLYVILYNLSIFFILFPYFSYSQYLHFR